MVFSVKASRGASNNFSTAWSDENASAVAPSTVNSEDFSRAGAVYEYFSYATETHLGVHQANGDVASSSFGVSLAAGPAAPSRGRRQASISTR